MRGRLSANDTAATSPSERRPPGTAARSATLAPGRAPSCSDSGPRGLRHDLLVVGVAADDHLVRRILEHVSHLEEDFPALLVELGRPRREEDVLREIDAHAFLHLLDLDLAAAHLALEVSDHVLVGLLGFLGRLPLHLELRRHLLRRGVHLLDLAVQRRLVGRELECSSGSRSRRSPPRLWFWAASSSRLFVTSMYLDLETPQPDRSRSDSAGIIQCERRYRAKTSVIGSSLESSSG